MQKIVEILDNWSIGIDIEQYWVLQKIVQLQDNWSVSLVVVYGGSSAEDVVSNSNLECWNGCGCCF